MAGPRDREGNPAAVRREDDIYKTQGHEYGYRYLSVNTAGDVASTCYDDVTGGGGDSRDTLSATLSLYDRSS